MRKINKKANYTNVRYFQNVYLKTKNIKQIFQKNVAFEKLFSEDKFDKAFFLR